MLATWEPLTLKRYECNNAKYSARKLETQCALQKKKKIILNEYSVLSSCKKYLKVLIIRYIYLSY